MKQRPVHMRGTDLSQGLASSGLRPTKQRRAIAQHLSADGHRHFDAATLHRELSEEGWAISLATVYNALRDFENAGLLRRVTIPGERTWFDTDTGNHHHFYVVGEDRLMDIESGVPVEETMVKPPKGYRISHVDMVVHLVADGDTDQ